MLRPWLLLPLLAALAPAQPPGKPDEPPAALLAFQAWLKEWTDGIVPLRSGMGRDEAQAERMERLFGDLAALGDLAAAQALFRAAAVPSPRVRPQELLLMEPWLVRRTARRLLAGMKGEGVAPWLCSQLLARDTDDDGSPVRAALAVVAEMRLPGARERIEKIAHDGLPGTRLAALRALGELGDPAAVPGLRRCLKEGRPEVRCTAIGALARLLAPFTDETSPDRRTGLEETAAAAVLEDLGAILVGEPAWQVRAAAADALLELRTVRALPALIHGLRAEAKRAATGQARRVSLALGRGLRGLTGQDLPADRPEAWLEWWEKEGAKARIRPRGERGRSGRGAAGTYLRYFTIEIESERILFLVDASGSMGLKVDLKGKYADLPKQAIKFDLVRQELSKVVLALPPAAAVNVIFFNEEVRPFRPISAASAGLMPMTEPNREDLLEFLALTSPQGLTNLHGALDLALHAGPIESGRGSGRPSRTSPMTVDTIYLLSDGAPTTGQVIDPERILEMAGQANQVRKVAIHTITFGDVNNARFMEELARRNGGEHVHLE